MSVKSTIKTALRWTVPAGVNDFLLAEWKHLASSGIFDPEQRRVLAANRVFQNAHQGERGFILATGTSIKDQDLMPLRHETCIALNKFYLHKDYAAIKPRYHLINASPSHPMIGHELGLRWFREMEERLTGDVLFFNYPARRFIQEHGFFRNRRVHYLREGDSQRGFRKQEIDAARPLSPVHGAGPKTIQLALYLGFREIYLLGLDSDHLIRFASQVPTHFYEPTESVLGRSGLSEWDYLFWRNRQLVVWKDYELLKQLAEARGVRICNAAPGGHLETFERADYSALFMVPQHENSGHYFSS